MWQPLDGHAFFLINPICGSPTCGNWSHWVCLALGYLHRLTPLNQCQSIDVNLPISDLSSWSIDIWFTYVNVLMFDLPTFDISANSTSFYRCQSAGAFLLTWSTNRFQKKAICYGASIYDNLLGRSYGQWSIEPYCQQRFSTYDYLFAPSLT